MLSLHKLHDITEIVAMHVEMSLWAGKGQATRRVWSEVAQIPPLNESGEKRQFSDAASNAPNVVMPSLCRSSNSMISKSVDSSSFLPSFPDSYQLRNIYSFFYQLKNIYSFCCFITGLAPLPHHLPGLL